MNRLSILMNTCYIFGIVCFLYSCSKPKDNSVSPIILGERPDTNDVAFIGNEEGSIYAIDANTGKQKWVFDSDTSINCSPVVANGVLYIGNNGGDFFGIAASTGEKNGKLI